MSQQLSNATGTFDATQMPQLFRFAANRGDGSGEWEQRHLKISLQDIKASPTPFYKYGTFTVAIRDIKDTDAKPNILELFTNCNLDPTSPNYIASKMGDKEITWDATEKRHRELGKFDNRSKYLRVEMAQIADQGGLDPELLPFGFFGPPRFSTFNLVSGSTAGASSMILASGSIPFFPSSQGTITGEVAFTSAITNFTASIRYPSLRMRVSSSDRWHLKT